MIVITVALLCTFLSYYYACNNYVVVKKKLIFTSLFIMFSILMRRIINVNLNNDYFLYYNFDIFKKPTSLLNFILNEPYLYSIYTFFNFFMDEKKDVFLAIYWFNFLIITLFFIWLIFRKDIEVWKKMVLFVLNYFLFGFVLLRNGPAYVLFAMYFYYTFRDIKFNWVLITPFMHISSSLMLVTYFHKRKWYFKLLLFSPIILLCLFFITKPFLMSIQAFESILSKINIYSEGMSVVGILHILFFLFITVLVSLGFLLYKRKMLHPILVTTIFFYGFTFYINPIVAHRFSPYVLFGLLLYPFDKIGEEKMALQLNRLSVLLFPIFLYTLFNTHQAKVILCFLENKIKLTTIIN